MGIYELLVMDEELRTALVTQRSVGELRRLAVSQGMRTLREDGLRQVRFGVTSPQEVLRVCHL